MVVNPSKENLTLVRTFWSLQTDEATYNVSTEFQEILKLLVFLKQSDQLRVMKQVNLGVKSDLDDLPYETKNQVRASFDQVTTANVDYTTSNSLKDLC